MLYLGDIWILGLYSGILVMFGYKGDIECYLGGIWLVIGYIGTIWWVLSIFVIIERYLCGIWEVFRYFSDI